MVRTGKVFHDGQKIQGVTFILYFYPIAGSELTFPSISWVPVLCVVTGIEHFYLTLY